GPEFADALDDLAARGLPDEAAARFLGMTGMPPEALEQIKRSPHWPAMVALAHTLSRDLRLGNGGAVPLDRLAAIQVPVLALAGGESHGWAHDAANAIAHAVPHGEKRIVKGQQHAVDVTALQPLLEEFFA